jgi:hypothetical protein
MNHGWAISVTQVISSRWTSLEKLTALLDACSELGVDTGPRTIGDLGIIPLYSWYHKVVIFFFTSLSVDIPTI